MLYYVLSAVQRCAVLWLVCYAQLCCTMCCLLCSIVLYYVLCAVQYCAVLCSVL